MCTRLCYFEAWEHCVKTGWILFVLGMHIPMCSPYQFLGSLSSRLLWSHQPNGKPLLQGLFSRCKDSCFPLESSQLQWKNVISHVRNSRNTCSHTKYLCSSSLGTHSRGQRCSFNVVLPVIPQEQSGGKMCGSRLVWIWLTSLIHKATLFLNDYHIERSKRTCSYVTTLRIVGQCWNALMPISSSS
jgi:hypothetical protein